MVAARLHEHTGEARWRERGHALIRAFAGRAADLGLYAAAYLLAVDWHLSPATHLVVVGEPGDAVADRMHRDALATFVPRRLVRRLTPGDTSGVRPAPGHGRHGGRGPGAARIRLHRHELSRAGGDGGPVARHPRGARAGGGLSLALDPSSAQRQAIEAPLGPVLVVAGPGAGKTYCLIARIARLIAWHGFDPRRICAVTFTNKAADEIASRLQREIGPLAEDVTRGTLHALCFGLLRDHAAAAGLGAASGSPTTTTSGGCCAGSGSGPSATAQLLLLFGRHRLQHVPLTAGDLELFARLPRGPPARNLLDYDDLIARAGELLRSREDVART